MTPEKLFSDQALWDALLRDSGCDRLFLSYNWQQVWWQTYAAPLDAEPFMFHALDAQQNTVGIIPMYAVIVREYFPPKEAGARIGVILMASLFGMAFGGWLSGYIFDLTGSYRAAFFNGGNIYSIFKGRIGRDCVAVGNILRSTDVVDAMAESFEADEGQPLAERLMRAIEAGDAAGGELKQIKSAGLLVVHRESFPFVDLRVDLSPTPLRELRFLWELYQPAANDFVVRAVDPDRAAPPL